MTDVLAYAISSSLAIGLALSVAVACVLQYRVAARVRPEWRLAVVLLVVGFGALLSVALTSRDLDETRAAVDAIPVTYDDFAEGFTASRWLSLFLVAGALVEIARGWLEARARATPDPARPVLATMLAYYFGTALIQASAADHPEFSARVLYVPILLAAVWCQRPLRLAPLLDAARAAILALMLCSLAGIWLRPDFVMHRPDPGWLPGIDWRLYGFAEHANTLAPVALLGLLVELHAPARRAAVRWLLRSSCAAVLVLAQSKTIWATVPLMAAVVWLPLSLSRPLVGGDLGEGFRHAVLTLAAAIAVLVIAAGAAVAFDLVGFIEHRPDLVTLTGRTQIWDITLHAWHDNVLFGYGAGIWGAERQREFGMTYVGQAHNQIVQTLGEAGLVGLGLLLAYLATLIATALRDFVASRGIVLMLLMVLLVRCITEAPMRAEGVLSWNTFLHALLVLLACHYARRRVASGVAPAPGVAPAVLRPEVALRDR